MGKDNLVPTHSDANNTERYEKSKDMANARRKTDLVAERGMGIENEAVLF